MTSVVKTLRATYPRAFQVLGVWRRPVGTLNSIGDHTLFYGRALAGIPFAITRYGREIIRLIAEILAIKLAVEPKLRHAGAGADSAHIHID